MDLEDPPFVRRRELAELLYYLNDLESRGVLLLGVAGAGKTALLRMVEGELKRQGRAVFFVSFRHLRYPGELGTHVLDAIAASPFTDADGSGRTLRTSAGAPPLQEAAAILRHAGARMPSPVLLFDGLDESVYPLRMAAAVEELSLALDGWKLVVASRPAAVAEIGRFARFGVVQLRDLTDEEAAALLREYTPELSEVIISRIVELASGSPLFLRLVAWVLQRSGSLTAITDFTSVASVLERLVNEVVETSSDPAKLSELLEELALAGGRDRIATLASKSRIAEEEVRRLLGATKACALLVLDDSAGTAAFFHVLVRDVILSRRILACRFRLVDLKFGAEEAERDELLDESFVRRRSLEVIFDQRRSVIVGDRGSGKSAIFRKLATDTLAVGGRRRVEIYPVANTGDLLRRVVDKDAWLDADALRAAWLVLVASVVSSTITASAPKKLRRNAADLRAAFGFPAEPASLVRRALRAAVRPLGGTTLKFAVGPVNLEAKLPSGSGGRSSKTFVDVESFLQEADGLLRGVGRRVVVIFDRIDEVFKYDRVKQEVVVQALLQAEGRVSLFEHIGLVVFLRTDLFELYDIQEKNKLVSRTLALDWSEEEWLQVLVRRVLANGPLQGLAERLHVADGATETRTALEVLFPSEIEGQPVDRWLIDSLRNGNGDVSPRLAVLLLHLTRELSARPEDVVSTLPLFSAEAVRKAMTKLSDLSFSEVVNDFKVAPSFVLNCRAGKLDSFALHEVEELFDEAEGKISEQVRLLERLGFLERVARESGSGVSSLFRIPKLYTRCWDHA
jgi:NACHT domain